MQNSNDYAEFLRATRDKVAEWIVQDKVKNPFLEEIDYVLRLSDKYEKVEKENQRKNEKWRRTSEYRQWDEELQECDRKAKAGEDFRAPREQPERPNDLKPEIVTNPLDWFDLYPPSLSDRDRRARYYVLLLIVHDGYTLNRGDRATYIRQDLCKAGSLVDRVWQYKIYKDPKYQALIEEAEQYVARDLEQDFAIVGTPANIRARLQQAIDYPNECMTDADRRELQNMAGNIAAKLLRNESCCARFEKSCQAFHNGYRATYEGYEATPQESVLFTLVIKSGAPPDDQLELMRDYVLLAAIHDWMLWETHRVIYAETWPEFLSHTAGLILVDLKDGGGLLAAAFIRVKADLEKGGLLADQQKPQGKDGQRRAKEGDKEQTTPETDITTVNNGRKIELIDDFWNWTDKLINYIKHPDENQEVSKAKADYFGEQINFYAKKIWPHINFDKIGWPHRPTDIPANQILYSGTVLSIQPELKERIIERLQQWKDRALSEQARAKQDSPRVKNIHIQNFQGIFGDVQARNVQTGDHAGIDKHGGIERKKKSIVRKVLEIVAAVVAFLAAVLTCFYYLGWLEPVKVFIYRLFVRN